MPRISGPTSGGGGGGAAIPTVQELGALGATETIDMASETWVWATGTLDENCAVTLDNLAEGDVVELFFVQDGTGGNSLSINAASVAIATAADAAVRVTCLYDGTDLQVDVAGGGGIQETLFDAKGDLIAGSAADTAARLAVGSGGYRLVPNSSAATGLEWVPHIVRKTANQSITTADTTPEDVTGLSWAVAANEEWFFKLILRVAASGTATDGKIGWTVPAGATMEYGEYVSTGWRVQGAGASPAAFSTELSNPTFGTAAQSFGLIYEGTVIVSATAGTVQFQMSQNTSSAETLTVLKNSHLLLYRLSP